MVLGTLALVGFLGLSAANRFLRAGDPVNLTFVAAAESKGRAVADPAVIREKGWSAFLNLSVRELTDDDRKLFGIEQSAKGVVVVDAQPPRGVAPGDIVTRIGEVTVTDAASLGEAFVAADAAFARSAPGSRGELPVVIRRPFIGDYQHYYFAARAVLNGGDIYRQHVNCYGYLPMFAITQAPLVPLGFQTAGAIWAILCAVFTLAAIYWGAREINRCLGFPVSLEAIAPVMLISAIVMSDKIKSDFRLGQTDAPILLAFVLGLVALRRWPIATGWCMGFIANFKYQSLAFVPYFVVRGRWWAAGWSVLSAVLLAWGGVLLWGWETNQRFLRDTLGALFRMLGSKEQLAVEEGVALYGLSWHRSVSIPSTLARLGDSLGIANDRLPKYGTVVLAAAAFAIGWWMFSKRGFNLFAQRSPRHDDVAGAGTQPGTLASGRGLIALEWSGLIVATLVFSPQSTARHFFLVLFPLMFSVAMLIHLPSARAKVIIGLTIAAMWAALALPPGLGDEVINPFRIWGVPSWAALVMYFVALWYGLGWLKERMAVARV